MNAPFKWQRDEYAWFFIPGVAGGTDVSFWPDTDDDLEAWFEEFETREPAKLHRELIRSCLVNRYRWNFRRSVGQPGIINFAYGILAASLVELTQGFVDSDDGAWDYKQLPATAEEFYQFYFSPCNGAFV